MKYQLGVNPGNSIWSKGSNAIHFDVQALSLGKRGLKKSPKRRQQHEHNKDDKGGQGLLGSWPKPGAPLKGGRTQTFGEYLEQQGKNPAEYFREQQQILAAAGLTPINLMAQKDILTS